MNAVSGVCCINDGNLFTSSTTEFASDTPGSEIAFVNLDNAAKRYLSVAFIGNPDPDRQEMPVNRGPVDAQDLRNFDRLQIENEESVELSKLGIRKSGTFKVTVRH